jgi:hypothetical protein
VLIPIGVKNVATDPARQTVLMYNIRVHELAKVEKMCYHVKG